MADHNPSKDEIQSIFKKLRALPTNKVCFDCEAKNPTWATVTYGVFICIDCSAVHRSLGVHLTFVRSTQLDTNWTWLQLRQMQLGGNAGASVFFRQHNCLTTDAQQKYTSRAAQLYKDKLYQMAVSAMRIYGTELHLDPSIEKHDEKKKEVDFFEEHSSFSSFQISEGNTGYIAPGAKPQITTPVSSGASLSGAASLSGKGPSVDLSSPPPPSGERKSIIGGRKPPTKKTGMGGKKAGLGAQRVQTNFADLEKQAEMIDERKERHAEEKIVTEEEEQEQMTSMRLAYQDLSVERQNEEQRLKRSDPKKAQQVERLGMGVAPKSSFSHSALSDMKTIEQESPVKKNAGKSKFDADDGDDFFDDYSFPTSLDDIRAMNRNKFKENSGVPGYNHSPTNLDDLRTMMRGGDSSSSAERDRYGTRGEKISSMSSSKSWYDGMSQESRPRREPPPASGPVGDDAQKKFGNAKAISSDQFFGQTDDNNYERKANLSRFEGSTSISSSDYFQDGRGGGGNNGNRAGYGPSISSSISAPDLDDVKESVRQGVTKVAGRISSLANGVINSIQDRYGY